MDRWIEIFCLVTIVLGIVMLIVAFACGFIVMVMHWDNVLAKLAICGGVLGLFLIVLAFMPKKAK